MNRLTYGHFFALISLVLLVPAAAQAQTGSVTVKGTVSEVVTLSITEFETWQCGYERGEQW